MGKKEIVWAGVSLEDELEAIRKRDKMTFAEEMALKERLEEAHGEKKEEKKNG